MEKHHETIRHPPRIELGDNEIDTWFSSAYPQEYATKDKLYICEFCLSYMSCPETMSRHNVSTRKLDRS